MKNSEKDIRISVIVPIYNAEKYLIKCLESIVNQTYKNLEIVLVDDGSTDKSLKICNDFSKRDNRIIVIHKDNGGLVEARKTGIENITGDYISFVDADDYIDLEAYGILVSGLQSFDVDILLYGMWEDYEQYSVQKKNHYPAKVYERTEIENILFPSMLSYGDFFDFGVLPNLVCKLIKYSFWKKSNISVDKEVKIGEDADFLFQLFLYAKKVQVMDYAPYHYCKRNDSMMWKEMKEKSLQRLEEDLRNAFRKSGMESFFQKQLEDYIAFVTLLKCPKKILKDIEIFKKGKIALYGAGGFGQAVYGSYYDKISLWIDKNYERYTTLKAEIQSVEALKIYQDKYDYVFIAILNTKVCEDIKTNLISMGITKPIFFYDRR